nr:reverse transcriptase domain-containing protein [Tanacetum cinerariifolium]
KRALPFFDTLKNITKENKNEFRWMKAFQELKKLIMELPTLTTPSPKETLYVYLAASGEAVSGVLIADRKGKQTLIRYVSRTLHEEERNDAPLEKLALCLLHLSRRLRRYFEARPIKMITDQPVKQIHNKREASGKLAKYAVELGSYNITYIPRNAVKGQVLADFLNEVPVGARHLEMAYVYSVPAGSIKTRAAAAPFRLDAPSVNKVHSSEFSSLVRLYTSRCLAPTGTSFKKSANTCPLTAFRGIYENKNEFRWMKAFQELKKLIMELPTLTTPSPKETLYVYLAAFGEAVSGVLIADRKGKQTLIRMAKYMAKAKELPALSKSYQLKTIRYLAERQERSKSPPDENKPIRVGGRNSVQEVIYVPNVKIYGSVIGKLYYKGSPRRDVRNARRGTISGWKNYEAGILLAVHAPGHQGEGPGRLKFIIVAINYFTKWIEAKPLAKITSKEVKKFVWENIMCRFGFPRVIVTDNGTQLVNDPFKSWCEKWKIKQMNTAVAHPQANGLVERDNKSLMHSLKARLGRERVRWVDELSNILWAHRTMLKTSNGNTPLSLTYGSEAVISAEIGMPTYRTIQWNEAQNEKEMRLKYKKNMKLYYNKTSPSCVVQGQRFCVP